MRGLGRGGAYVTRHRLKHGYWAAARRYTGVSIVRALKGIGQLIVAPVLLPFAMNRFKFTALEGGRNLFIAAGALGGLLLLQYEYYRKIDGC
jgi:succinoglycan biosynthesis protein ExoM